MPVEISQPCKRERTQAAILAAARRVIADKDIDAASIDELMQAAGMARGTFYNHFASREALLQAVLDDIRGCLRDGIEARIPAALPPEGILACMMYGFLRFGQAYPDAGMALMRMAASKDWLTLRDSARRAFPRTDAALQALLGDTPFAIGQAYVEGVANQVLRHVLDGHLDEAAGRRVLALSLRGLGVTVARLRRAEAVAAAFTDGLVLP